MKSSSLSYIDGNLNRQCESCSTIVGLKPRPAGRMQGWQVAPNAAPFLRAWCLLLLGSLAGLGLGNAEFSQARAQAPDVQLYFFTNAGCAPCRQVEPEIESLRRAGYNVMTVHLDQHPQWGEQFSVDRTPTVIMVANQRIVGRHAGLIDAETLKQWFAAVGGGTGNSASTAKSGFEAASISKSKGDGSSERVAGQMLATYSELPEFKNLNPDQKAGQAKFAGSPTLHAGTTNPATEAERQAMNATVRLKVQDAEGVSYATGTVIHSHQGEWLVMTCGHTFREAGSKGRITAEFDFSSGNIQTADAELISYDADSRDVALVAVRAGRDIEPVQLADVNRLIDRGLTVFTIGCDGGSNPTIRHTQIKNKAVYASAEAGDNKSPGAIKYDIYGRPAIGRSGGGLFNEAGELIGVCNAAAVESDEGIYSALDSLHWQIAKSNLGHLFGRRAREDSVAANHETQSLDEFSGSVMDDRFASLSSRSGPNLDTAASPSAELGMQPIASLPKADSQSPSRLESTASSTPESSDTEVIIIVRSKTSPQLGESITISDPTPQLIQYLGEMRAGSENRKLDFARVRHDRVR